MIQQAFNTDDTQDFESDLDEDLQDFESVPFTSEFAQNLREQTAAVRLSHSRLGVRKALSRTQVLEAAEGFGADGEFLSASKRLINTNDEVYKAVTGVISRARAYWQTMTVPYPIKGIRLIRKDLLPVFTAAMERFRDELNESVQSLSARYQSLQQDAQDRLGTLYNPQDYPATVNDHFRISWDFPNVEPPNYLKELNPEIYEQQAQLVQSRFEQSLKMAEEMFTTELQSLVSHLVERLSDEGDDEKPKVFKNTAVTNLQEFFARFQTMNIRSNTELNKLIEQAEGIIAGIDPKDLRKDSGLRKGVAQQMESVKELLDNMVTNAPSRAFDLED